MTPPVKATAAPVVPADSCNLSPIDLSPFQQIPEFQTLHPLQQANLGVRNFYDLVQAAKDIDKKIGGAQKTQNGQLDSTEVDNFIQSQASDAPPIDTCTFMNQFRMYASQLPHFIKELEAGPDLKPVSVDFFSGLPYLKEFSTLVPALMDNFGNMPAMLGLIHDSKLPEALKKAFSADGELINLYIVSLEYLKMDSDRDGQISQRDLLQQAAALGDTPENAEKTFYQMKIDSASAVNAALGLREELNMPAPPGILHIKVIAFLAEMLPDFIHAHEGLTAFIRSAFPKDANNQVSPSPAVQDMIITLEEFKNFPEIKNYLLTTSLSAEELFAQLQFISTGMGTSLSLWPEDLMEAFKKLPKEKRDFFESLMYLSVEQQRIDFALRMMEAESSSKYTQERELDHPHEHRGFMVINGLTWLFSGGETTYGNYFHNERPAENKKVRDDAILALKNTLRSGHFGSIAEATAYMANQGQSAEIEILNEKCSLATWVRLAEIQDNVERNRATLQVAEDFRRGTWGSFWDWQIVPSPSLGKGGWFARASDFENWSWIKSPQTIMALSLNNYIATETPNNWGVKHQADFDILTSQLPEEQGKAFATLIQKISAGEAVDMKDVEQSIQSDTLSAAGQTELLAQVNIELVRIQNQKLIEDPEFQAAYQTLNDEQKAEADHLIGNSAKQIPGAITQLFTDPLSPLDPAKVKLAIESLDSSFSKVVDIDISHEKQLVLGLQEKNFPKNFNQALINAVGQMKRVEGGSKPAVAVEALFREAKFPDDVYARKLFNLLKPSLEQSAEFNELVKGSALSDANKAKLLGIMLLQPNTFVAEAAEDNFMAILGDPFPDPITGKYSAAYTGNLHSALRSTFHRTIFGVGALAAPTLVSGSIGQAFFRSVQNYARIPVEEITGFRRFIGGRLLHALGNSSSARRWALNFSPRAGAIGAAIAGTALFFTVTPYGEELKNFSYEALTYPYFPWSDMATRALPMEGIQLYLDTCASLQGMDGVLLGARTIGSLEIGTRIAGVARSFQVGARLANHIEKRLPRVATWLRGETVGLQGTRGIWNSMKSSIAGRTESQIAEAALKNADDAAAAWAADVQGLNTAERIWAKTQYGHALKQLALKRSHFGGARFNEIYEELAKPGLEVAQRQALHLELQGIYKSLSPAAAKNIAQAEMRAQSLRVLGKVGNHPEFSKSILNRAKKWIEQGTATSNAELVERGWLLLEKGAAQYAQLPLMAMHNQKLAKFMLWMLFHEKVDEVMRPKTPITPDFPESIAAGVIVPPPAHPEAVGLPQRP